MLSGTDQLAPLRAAFLVEGIELAQPIGRGGSATVWGARWRSREVAVKVAEQTAPLGVAPSLDHPGILSELARGSVLGRPYAVLDRFPGDLASLLRAGPLSRRLRRPILAQLLDALDYAHRRGTVHGDLKPANVLVDPAARPVRVALTDFGRAARAPEAALEASMLSSDRQGEQTYATLAYLAPERLEGGAPSQAADLYAFGVLLFELLTGRLPQGLELPSELQRGLDRRFDALVKRCLARDPAGRPASANAVRREVLALCPPGGKAARDPASPPPRANEGMVLIPGGFLVVGDRDDPASSPMHERQLSPFWIDRHPVTNRRYLAYVLATKARRPSSWPQRGRLRPQLLDQPVTGVDWDEALAFARWEGKRLPTEFEWERAAQGPEQRSQPYGEVFDPSRVQLGLGPVGASASSEGVCDLTGNGWEWTASAFGAYPDPSPHTELRALRGGLDPVKQRASAHLRAGLRRDARDGLVTFRCARDARQKGSR